MKVSLKTHQYATVLTYFYLAGIFVSVGFRLAGVELTGALYYLKLALLQATYAFLFFYLNMILIAFNEPRRAAVAFSMYAALTILAVGSILFSSYSQLRVYSIIIGVLSLVVLLYLFIQVFKLRHPVISRCYKILGIALGASAVVRVATPITLGYLGDYFNNSFYRYGWVYADVFSALVPVSILIILNRTKVLLDNYPQPVEIEEEYL